MQHAAEGFPWVTLLFSDTSPAITSWKNDKVADERIREKSGVWSNSLIFKGYVHLIRLLSSKMGGSLRTHVTI